MNIQEHTTWGCMLLFAVLLVIAALWVISVVRCRRKRERLAELLQTIKKQSEEGGSRSYFYHVKEDTFYHFDVKGQLVPVDPEVMLVSELSEMAMHVREVATDVLSGKLPAQTLLMNEAHWEEQAVLQLFIQQMEASKELLQINVNDVTEGYRIRKQSRQNQMRFDATFNHTSYSVMFFDKDGVMTNLNEIGVQHLFGKSREDILSQHIKIHELFDVPAPSDDWQPTSLCVLDPRGNFETAFTPMFDDDHHIEGIFLLCRDITQVAAADHKHRENIHRVEDLREEMNRYVTQADIILKDNAVGLMVYDPAKSIVEIRHRVMEEGVKVRVMDILQWIQPYERDRMTFMYQEMNELVDKNYDEDFETNGNHRFGDHRVLRISYVPVKDREGKVIHYSGMVFDATDRANTDREIEVATRAARENEKIKNTFLKHITSDVHTPIHQVLEHVEKLKQDLTEAEQQQSIHTIQANSMQLLDLVNDVLYYSRLEANRVESKKEEVDLGAMFDTLCQQCMEGIDCVKLIVNNPFEHLLVDVDIPNLSQVLRFLFKMVARYLGEGNMEMTFSYHNESMIFEVKDHGRGLNEEQGKALVSVIEGNEDPDLVSKFLTATVIMKLIKLMGGKVDVRSNEGTGTTGWIIFPAVAKEVILKKNI